MEFLFALLFSVDLSVEVHCRPDLRGSQPWALIEEVTTQDSVVLESYLRLKVASPYHYESKGVLHTTFNENGRSWFTSLEVTGSYVDIPGENSANLQAIYDDGIERIYLDFSDSRFANGSFIRRQDGVTFLMDCGSSAERP